MQPISAITVFCEDVREEKTGTEIIIGIYPDNVNVPEFPTIFPKMALYTRVHVQTDYDIGEDIAVILQTSHGGNLALTKFNPDIIKKAKKDAAAKAAPTFGLIARTVMSMFHIPAAGRITSILRIADDQEIICGSLNVQKVPNP